MGKFQSASFQLCGHYKAQDVLSAALYLRNALITPARMAFAFVSPDFMPHIADFCETLRVDGHIQDIVGCTTRGHIEGGSEYEDGCGFSVIAFQGEFGDPQALDGSHFSAGSLAGSNGSLFLANPFAFPVEEWIEICNRKARSTGIVGGLASGGSPNDTAVFINGVVVDAVSVTLHGRTGLVPALSHGCKPIGEPFTVTRAEQNVIYALGGQPAYMALENAFATLSEQEKSRATGNLFAGLAGSEYVHEFRSGDFLVKNIIGADPSSGAVMIAGIPRVGQTLQYQIRNPEAALDDLARGFETVRLARTRAYGGLLFSCLARGKNFFGSPNRDATSLFAALGGKPLAGCFCNGEIAPVRGLNALHGYTAAAAVLVENIL